MVSGSKILTVSYGTFSCTLEGFDDSFETMKAIAEYFRDLAAEDRYFGAEPPTPDAEMLARIAEREMSRRVEALQGDGNIVLRASDAGAATGGTAGDVPPPAPLAEPAAEPEAEPRAAAAAPAPDPVPDPIPEPSADAAPQAPVDETPVEAAQPEAAEEAAEEVAPQEVAEAPLEDIPQTPDMAEDAVADAPAEDEETAAQPADTALTAQAGDETAQDEDEEDSIAAKLRRIRSVVLQSEQASPGDEYTEDQHAEIASDPQVFLENSVDALETALADDDATESAGTQPAEAAQDDLDAILARFDGDQTGTAAPADMSDADAPDEDAALAARPETADDSADDDTKEDEPDAAAAPVTPPVLAGATLAQLMADANPALQAAAQPVPEADKPAEPADAEASGDAGPTPPAPVRARVVKIKRTEFEAAIASGQIEEEPDDAPYAEVTGDSINVFNEDLGDTGLSPEDEAELQRELAEVEAEMRKRSSDNDPDADDDVSWFGDDSQDAAPDTADETLDPSAPKPADPDQAQDRPAAAPGITGRDKLEAEAPRTDISRMFEEADNQRKEPESNRRRSVIQHLRAAVAATRADKKAGVETDPEKDQSPYRSDLADVVRPRRPSPDPAGSRARPPRPDEPRPAPLKLVAEQRIDMDPPGEAVMPRRVSSSDLQSDQAGDTGFTDFVRQAGAQSLPDLLEAAAAYLSDVEGRPQFSRPMLMGKLREVVGDDFSREDGLRSFGKLLRDGKLQKLKSGRFSVTDDTEFRTQKARNAG